MKSFLVLGMIFLLAANVATGKDQDIKPVQVKPGIEVLLEENLALVADKRVGLITNPTGVTSALESSIDVLFRQPRVKLVALFGPEHGVRGDVFAGEKVGDFTDEKTGLPVHSLYGKTRKPTQAMLKDLDVLIYDIQDIGSRAYTYIYTLALAMEAARDQGIPILVLDRPNPLGGLLLEGPVLEPAFKSFIGMYPIPYIYGLTVGELAQLFNQEFAINADLTVIPMQGWQRNMTFAETGLEWVPTSPHIPHAKTAYFCAAIGCIGELHTINEGVGYTSPFELIGAPWIQANALADSLNRYQLPGVLFRPLHYRPYYFGFKDQKLQGVQIHITDMLKFKPMVTQIHILCTLRKLYPNQPFLSGGRIDSFDKAMGTDKVRIAIDRGDSPASIIESWQAELEQFMQIREKYLIYKE